MVLLSVFTFGCRREQVKHDPERALSNTKQFVKVLYCEKAVDTALALTDASLRQFATSADLQNILDKAVKEVGKTTKLTADSYLMAPGRNIEIFYVATGQKGVLYHRIVVTGDAASGYKVTGAWFQTQPYPSNTLRRRFHTELTIECDLK